MVLALIMSARQTTSLKRRTLFEGVSENTRTGPRGGWPRWRARQDGAGAGVLALYWRVALGEPLGQKHVDRCARIRTRRLGPDASAVGNDNGAAEIKAQARARDAVGARGGRAAVALEEEGRLVVGDADALIVHTQMDAGLFQRQGHPHRCGRRGVLERVREQVLDHLLEAGGVPGNSEIPCGGHPQAHPFRGLRRKRDQGGAHERGEIHRCQLQLQVPQSRS